jgi:hypothetical protein
MSAITSPLIVFMFIRCTEAGPLFFREKALFSEVYKTETNIDYLFKFSSNSSYMQTI